MRNKIAWKLTLYFAAVLLIFALVVGGTFMHFFGKHTQPFHPLYRQYHDGKRVGGR